MTPHELLRTILNKKAITLNSRGEHPNDFVLKVCGQEEYLVGNFPLTQFQYVQDMLARDGVPTLVTVSVNSILGKDKFVMFHYKLQSFCYLHFTYLLYI
jgi:phosphatidylinositol-4,5-bisphosphate 3-kinase